jgi:hypothetical protein
VKGTVVKITSLALALIAVVVLGLFNLGLITIAGAGVPRVRYQSEEVTTSPEGLVWAFDDLEEAGLPPGAEVLSNTQFGGWGVRAEPGTPSEPNALCQTGMGEFPAIALGEPVLGDLVMSSRFKPTSGRVDQAAGLIFRVQDGGNYYILRANALEGNVNLYKYAGGRRSLLKEGPAEVRSGEWQELKVEVAGNHFRGLLNGLPVVEATDDDYPVGRVGLWTKADSVTCFDDVTVTRHEATHG